MGKRNKIGKNNARKTHNKASHNKHFSARNSAINKNSTASTKVGRKIPEGGSKEFYRDNAKIKRIKMYNQELKKKDYEKMREVPDKPARINPDRKWFGNVRTINQKTLENLRKEMESSKSNTKAYSVLLKKHKVPKSLLTPLNNVSKTNKLHASFKETFGPDSRRTKPTLSAFTIEELSSNVEKKLDEYSMDKDTDYMKKFDREPKGPETKYMSYGQSKRIFSELHKVIDSSDVICTVIDARDPLNTRCTYVEKFVKKNAPHKHIVLVLNKCDLIPTWATAAWVKHLSKEFPTIAFHASINNPFGKTAFFNLLKQFEKFHRDKKNISIGFVGYPNVGKSSIINTMKKKAVCKSAPIPGETKVWQYVTLTNRMYLIDCPGVVYDCGDSETEKVLKGIVRAEKLEDPIEYCEGILEKAKKKYLQDTYCLEEWTDLEDFLTQIAKKTGKLLKGAEPDLKTVSKMLLMDWQRGKIPYFVPPPSSNAEELMPEGNENTNFKVDEQKYDEIINSTKFDEEDKNNVIV